MPKLTSILVVEDNLALQELMVDHLLKDGYQVHGVGSAEEMDDFLASNRVDIFILDIGLPGEDGLSIAKRLRAANPSLYIVMLTAKTSERDRTLGYENGADMYLSKPASPLEVSAVISGIERRIRLHEKNQALLSLDIKKMQIEGELGAIHLGAMEVTLLKALAEAPNNKLDYWRLLELLEKEPTEKDKAALGVQVHRLKQKIADAGGEATAIKSVFNEGYQLTTSVQIV